MLPGRLPCPVHYQCVIVLFAWCFPCQRKLQASPGIAINYCKDLEQVCLQVNIGTVKPFWDVTLKILEALADKKQ